MIKLALFAFSVYFAGCSAAPDVPSPAVYCVTPEQDYMACDSSHPWYYADNNPLDHAIFCACDEACGTGPHGCPDGDVCALLSGAKGVCKYVP